MRLSVIIPIYNTQSSLLERCLESVVRATSRVDEIICVDDGSQPPFDLAKLKIADKSRIRIVRRDNGGLPVARNTGMDVAQGEFITFVDSDDEVGESIYANSISKLSQTNADVCVFGVCVVWASEGLKKVDIPIGLNACCLNIDDLSQLVNRKVFNYAWNKVFRRGFLLTHNLRFVEDAVPCEDVIFNLDVVSAGARWTSLLETGYIYWHRTNGSIVSAYSKTGCGAVRMASDRWKNICDKAENVPSELCGEQMSEREILQYEWGNIWRRNSPVSLFYRWEWLCANSKELGVTFRVLYFVKKYLYCILRRYCYVRMLRRWHLRKLHGNIENWEK